MRTYQRAGIGHYANKQEKVWFKRQQSQAYRRLRYALDTLREKRRDGMERRKAPGRFRSPGVVVVVTTSGRWTRCAITNWLSSARLRRRSPCYELSRHASTNWAELIKDTLEWFQLVVARCLSAIWCNTLRVGRDVLMMLSTLCYQLIRYNQQQYYMNTNGVWYLVWWMNGTVKLTVNDQ